MGDDGAGARLNVLEAPTAGTPMNSSDNVVAPALDESQFVGMTESERVKAKARLLLDMRYGVCGG